MESLRSDRWDEVARRIDERMDELQFVQADVARLGSVSATTVRSLLRADRDTYRRGSLRGVSRALQWVPTALEDLASNGKDPEPVIEFSIRGVGPEDLRVQITRIEGKLDILLAALGTLIAKEQRS